MKRMRSVGVSSGVLCLVLINCAFALTQQDSIIQTGGTIIYPPKILRADNVYGLSEADRNNATKIAENLDLYITWTWQGQMVNELHSLKPSMKVLVYRNVRVIYKIHAPDEWKLALANNWVLKDANGNMIYCTVWPENYMVDIGSSSYQDFVVNWIKNALDTYGFDGVWADYGLEYGVPTWAMTGHPINPRTGQLYTDDEWINDLITLINKIKNATGSKLYVGNGIHTGSKWLWSRGNYEKVLNQSRIDGFMSEGLFTASSWNLSLPSSWYSEEQWKQSLDFLVWIQNNFLTSSNKLYMAWSYSHSDQESTFIITSFLLGVDKFHQNYVTPSKQMMTDYVKRLANIEIGVPTESYHIVEGTHVYERDFTRVKVLVNPSSDPYVVSLEKAYETLEGEVVSSVTVNPHTGTVLIDPNPP